MGGRMPGIWAAALPETEGAHHHIEYARLVASDRMRQQPGKQLAIRAHIFQHRARNRLARGPWDSARLKRSRLLQIKRNLLLDLAQCRKILVEPGSVG